MTVPTLLRQAEHHALSHLILSGKVLDLGGERYSDYLRGIGGEHTVTTVNNNESAQPDVMHDLEQPLPFANATYDHALLINVLEHIYNYRRLLSEAERVVKPGGSIIIVVPFLFPIHPSPHDYWRFTGETLEKECEAIGLHLQTLLPLGKGVFSAQYLLIDRLMPWPVRFLTYYSLRYIAFILDALFTGIARLTKRKYNPADYALGYMVVASK